MESVDLMIKILKKIISKNHPLIHSINNNFGTILTKLNTLEDAKKIYNEFLIILKNIVPQNHPDILQLKNNLAGILIKFNNFSEA